MTMDQSNIKLSIIANFLNLVLIELYLMRSTQNAFHISCSKTYGALSLLQLLKTSANRYLVL